MLEDIALGALVAGCALFVLLIAYLVTEMRK